MSEFKTRADVLNAGGVLVEARSGATWNDGGSWYTWVYYLPSNGEYWLVHNPSNYNPEVEIKRVTPRVVTRVEYDAKEPPR